MEATRPQPAADAERLRRIPEADAIMARASGENFPVASLVLPRAVRGHLLAIYGFARLVDELGDEHAGDRLAALDWLQEELDRAYAGSARHPLLLRLAPTLRSCSLPRGPFVRLIEANRVDQRVARYETWDQLLAYCDLSANPVGELVLGVFGLASPERVAHSDRICTALQLTEHWQDIAEDMGRGRIYLPLQDMREYGCEASMLSPADGLPASGAPEPLRRLLAREAARTRELFRQGAALMDMLHGRPRLAVAGFLGGGLAALQAIERRGFEVLGGPPHVGGARRTVSILAVLAGRRP